MENTEELTAIIADNLTYYRKKALLTQSELAEKINYSDKSISKWERGDGTPDVFVLHELAKLYGLSVNDFLTTKKKERVANFFISKLLLTIVIVAIIWFVAIFAFFLTNMVDPTIKDTKPTWLVFIYAIPVSCLALWITNHIFFDKRFGFIPITAFLWTAALATHLTFATHEGITGLYTVCIPITVVIILIYVWKFWFKRKKSKK